MVYMSLSGLLNELKALQDLVLLQNTCGPPIYLNNAFTHLAKQDNEGSLSLLPLRDPKIARRKRSLD